MKDEERAEVMDVCDAVDTAIARFERNPSAHHREELLRAGVRVHRLKLQLLENMARSLRSRGEQDAELPVQPPARRPLFGYEE